MEDDRAVVRDLDVFELVVEDLGVGALEVLVRPLHVGRGDRLTIVELETRTQSERRPPEVGRQLGLLGQTIGDVPVRHRLDHGVVNQVVVHLLRHGVGVLEHVQPARVQGEMHRDRQRSLGGASRGVDLGGLDVELRERPGQDRGRRPLLRGRLATAHEGQTHDSDQSQQSLDHRLLLAELAQGRPER